MISAVDNNIIWVMSGTTSEAYCQQWTKIRGATCTCDAILFSKSLDDGENDHFPLHQLYFVKPGVFIDKEESEENEKWTDRALMLEFGRVNSIEIEEERSGNWITRIRAR